MIEITVPDLPDARCRLAVGPTGHATVTVDDGPSGKSVWSLERPFSRPDMGQTIIEFVEPRREASTP